MIKIAALILLGFVAIEALPANHEHAALWSSFKQTHKKSYKTVEEEIARFNIFIENHAQIQEHNKGFQAGLHTFALGMNEFGDMTNQEFRTYMNGYKRTSPKKNTNVHKSLSSDLPDSVDWRTKGYVTGVKNQGQCGGCWAFSATGSLEGQNFKKTGTLTSLSEQNLIDCVKKDQGCGGGFMDDAFDYIHTNNGVDTEASYPYTAKNGKCHYSTANLGATDTGFVDVKPGSESDLENAIATVGPISVAIDASKMSFQFYKKGVYNEQRCKSAQEDLDHGVLAVGYGADDSGTKYYIVKNSWGETWGDQGYILMSRENNNNCGIATDASYPTV